MIELVIYGYLFVVGACVGSFLNVVIYRLPMGRSVISPGSSCPACGSPVRAYDNIPLFSWLFLGGKCRDCGAKISPRYFFVELLTGFLTTLLFHTLGPTLLLGVMLLFVWGLIAITFIDLDYQVIPDELSIGGLLLGLALAPFLPLGGEQAFIGALFGGGCFYLLAILYPGGMGGGDVKMIATIGAFLGWQGAFLTILLSSVSGALIGIGSMIFFGKGRKSKIPFGPFLALGALMTLLYSKPLIGWYLTLVGLG